MDGFLLGTGQRMWKFCLFSFPACTCLSFCFFCSEGNSNKSLPDTEPMLVPDLEFLSLQNYDLNTSLLFINTPLSGIPLEQQEAD